ncbi:MAG TPA: nuclear transport factor 2 family protein [Bryobacteraceae bacterium]|nr:nuclear transport factor 2 family protein [Bryobacteraceae bacterium]
MARWWTILLLGASLLAVAAPKDDIIAVIQKSADDWNRGDLAAYVQCYEPSKETTFVSSEVVHGTDGILARYKRNYPDQAHMGKLTFSQLQVRPLSADIAIATGRFTLERAADAGGHATGLFTLVLRRDSNGWRIIHDHTHATP